MQVAHIHQSGMSCIRGQYLKRSQPSRLSFPILARRVAPCIVLQNRDDPTTAFLNPKWHPLIAYSSQDLQQKAELGPGR